MTNLVLYMVTVTAYCQGACCCAPYADGWTASGVRPQTNLTVAANWLPFGTKVYIEKVGWRTVQDRMAQKFSDRIDIYMPSHKAALQFGKRRLRVWVQEEKKK